MRSFGAGLILVAALVAAQTPAPPQSSSQTFRSGADTVEVDARVFKDGRFVTDLGPDDFELTEDGVPQKIRSVVLIGTAFAAPAPSSAPGASAAPTAPAAPPTLPPAMWLFVFDTPHLTAGGLQRTREAVETFFDQRWH